MAITLSATFVNKLMGTSTTAGVSEQLAGGSLVLYSGSAPTGANEALGANTALATFTFAAIGSWSAVSGGVQNLAFSATTVAASAAGTATFWRILDSSANSLIQGTATATGGGGDATFSSVTYASGDNVSITGTPSIALPVT